MREFCMKTLMYAIFHDIGDKYLIGCKAVEWHEKGYINDTDLADVQHSLFQDEGDEGGQA